MVAENAQKNPIAERLFTSPFKIAVLPTKETRPLVN